MKYWLLRRSGVDGVTVREKGLKVSGSVVARGEDCHPDASTGSTAASARRDDDKISFFKSRGFLSSGQS